MLSSTFSLFIRAPCIEDKAGLGYDINRSIRRKNIIDEFNEVEVAQAGV